MNEYPKRPDRQCACCRLYNQRLDENGLCDGCRPEPEQPWPPGMTYSEMVRTWNLSHKMIDDLLAAHRIMPKWHRCHAAQAIPLNERGLVEATEIDGNSWDIRIAEDTNGSAVAHFLAKRVQ